MTFNLLAFGIVREIFDGKTMSLELFGNLTAGGLKNELEDRFPELKKLASYLVAVNNEYAEDDRVIGPEDEIAIIPPVSGG